MKCVICNSEITPLYVDDMTKPWLGSWNGGGVCEMEMPYGSIYDMNKYAIAICDKCIGEKFKNGIIGKSVE